jgi:hypothetical protein
MHVEHALSCPHMHMPFPNDCVESLRPASLKTNGTPPNTWRRPAALGCPSHRLIGLIARSDGLGGGRIWRNFFFPELYTIHEHGYDYSTE